MPAVHHSIDWVDNVYRGIKRPVSATTVAEAGRFTVRTNRQANNAAKVLHIFFIVGLVMVVFNRISSRHYDYRALEGIVRESLDLQI